MASVFFTHSTPLSVCTTVSVSYGWALGLFPVFVITNSAARKPRVYIDFCFLFVPTHIFSPGHTGVTSEMADCCGM